MDEHLRDSRILIVDDTAANVTALRRLAERWGMTNLEWTTDSARAVPLCASFDPDLLLLDLHMPSPDGLEILEALEPLLQGPAPLPVLVLTADAGVEARRTALSLGARDFITKPFDPEEARLRIRNLLEMRHLQREQRRQNELLEGRVRDRTQHLDRARIEVLERLAMAAEYRDDDTGRHTARVARTSGLLARELGLPNQVARTIELAAPLHDIGKIALPDSILLKPGRLTPTEFAQMKAHAAVGADMLSGSSSGLLVTAEQIARSHHERWDGSGYPYGLAGEEIPRPGRIVAVADVFDALTHDRPYKSAWPLAEAVEEMSAGAGSHFDPAVVDAFLGLGYSLTAQEAA